ncbi:MAG TPA: DoxX family protein [Intrasporangium sp.]|nr:DoxX family protein [Intrasporangium sp.]
MDVVLLIGRILFVALFLASAMGHLTQSKAMGAYAESKGVPSPVLATQVSGVLILLGGISVLLGLWGDLGSLFLVVFLLPTALLIHGFWKETEPMAKQMEMVQFNKDVALAGGALVLFWAFSQDPGLTITRSLF